MIIHKFKISWTLWRYMMWRFFLQLLIIGGALTSLVYIFEVIELFRRAAGDNVLTSTIFWMGVLKLPETMQIITPFVFLAAALSLFWQLSKNSELVVLRANGVSVWRFIAPILCLTLTLGVLNFAIFQPIGAAGLARYQTLETKNLGQQRRIIALNAQGLWLREARDDKIWLLYARDISIQSSSLSHLMVLVLDPSGALITRFDAPSGVINDKDWVLQNGLETSVSGNATPFTTKTVMAGLDTQEILSGFTEAATLSSWQLPHQISMLKTSGFPTRSLLLYYYNLIAAPFLWMSMIMIALTVSLSPQRLARTSMLLGLGIGIGFFYFLFARYFEALSMTQRIPELMAIWTPIIVATFVPISVLLQKEDG